MKAAPLKSPYPWFGGKRRCADLVWQRFGDVPNYVEPFFGSGAVLLARPHPARTETINDKDCYVANFWRAVTADAEGVAHYADGPVNEADLHARHRWLVSQAAFRRRMTEDPEFYDAKIAGWWVWGISQWIGAGWCARPEWAGRVLGGRAARGIHTDVYTQRPNLTTVNGLHRKRVNLKRGGNGVHRKTSLEAVRPRLPDLGGNSGAVGKGVLRQSLQIPQLSGAGSGSGRGVLSRSATSRLGQWQTRPFLSSDGNGVQSQWIRANLVEYMRALQDRLRRVRVCCGDWRRVLGPSPTTCIGVTAVFLDPPYSGAANRDASIYTHDDMDLAAEVRDWAVERGHDPKLRIALCGYEGEHEMPASWTSVAWKANGGYGNQSQGRGRVNAGRERIWFSPYCLTP
jgi:hypothetical protein